MNKKVYIILLNYNGWKDTIECLESVLKSDYKNYQVIVVDNDSPNNSIDYIIDWADGKQEVMYDENSQLQHLSQPQEPKPLDYVLYRKEEALSGGDREKESKLSNPIVFIKSGENGGFAAGNNIGIQYALVKDDFKCVWLLNNDTVIKKNSLSILVNYASKKDVGICGSALIYYYSPKELQAYGGTVNKYFGTSKHILDINEIDKKLDYIVGASFLINKKVIEKIGLMPEEYFLYYEETDYCFNARNNGFKLGIAVDSTVYHKEGAKNKGKNTIFADKYLFKNRLKFAKKYLKNINYVHIGLILSLIKLLLKFEISRVVRLIRVLYV